jgi:hypothetical protein
MSILRSGEILARGAGRRWRLAWEAPRGAGRCAAGWERFEDPASAGCPRRDELPPSDGRRLFFMDEGFERVIGMMK